MPVSCILWIVFCFEFIYCLPAATNVLIRSLPAKNMSHSSQMSSETHLEQQNLDNNLTASYFKPKTYTVNDFHLLVEGMNTQMKTDHNQMLQRINLLEKKHESENSMSFILRDDYCALCKWTTNTTEITTLKWVCWMASLIGMIVTIVAIAFALIYLARCCWKCAHYCAQEKKDLSLKNQQQELLFA